MPHEIKTSYSQQQPTLLSFVSKNSSRLHQKHPRNKQLWYVILLSCIFWFFLFRYDQSELAGVLKLSDTCAGRYIYVQELPSRFNTDLIGEPECRKLNPWADMCPSMANGGLGPPLDNSDGAFSDAGWYGTDQFALEVIFHNRMKQYQCLTTDSSVASAIYVPFYVGLDLSRYLWGYNISVRDSTSLDLFRWLRSLPEWRRMQGKDHFMVACRTSWEFRRLTDGEKDWGSKFLILPETKNMTVLIIESSPWHSNDVAIPYPTYFHPSQENEVFAWQNRMRKMERPWQFSFAGAARPNSTFSIRNQIISQCSNSRRCTLLRCSTGEQKSNCNSPGSITRMFQSSVFCLQPPGDTYTRRSAFDSMVAGCIPVFFHPGSAYTQYTWHLPRNYTKYSVYISEEEVREGKVEIEKELNKYSEEQVKAMREEVIRMIPSLIYKDPRSSEPMERVKDAFDVAVEGVIERVGEVRRRLKGGLAVPAFEESETWKRALGWTGGEHEWDQIFYRGPK